MTRFGEPPVEYLRECSSTSLRYFEMSKLEHVANLRKELAALMDQMMEESALAIFARWMLEGRSIPQQTSENGNAAKGHEPRKTHSLLGDFISGTVLAAGSSAVANGQSARIRSGDRGTAKSPDESGVAGPGGAGAVKQHAAPQRGEARSERRLERRGPRPSRSPTRAV